ncbi:MAG: glycosyltransferase family 4 protein [Candidatus Nanopelagicales bacterium]|nr:glycosyltransferase family 4 protein [Candidatus Nanopelagicales bacterium]
MKQKLWIVTTVADSLDSLIEGQPEFLNQHFDVTIVSSLSDKLPNVAEREGVGWQAVKMRRTISPFHDLVSIWHMFRLLRKNQPDIIQSYTPKAGLVTMLSGRLARVPRRVHGVVGMPLMEARGTRRLLMKLAEQFTYFNATALTSNSFGLRDFVHTNLTKKIVTVIGNGSINGVDVDHYNRANFDSDVRTGLGISELNTVFVYVGRLVPDKGIVELVEAFVELANSHFDVDLLLVGEQEEALSSLPTKTREQMAGSDRIHELGWHHDVRPYLAAANVFILPSYREGLPNSVIEAGAMSLPSIVTDINGCNEVITEGVNGFLIPIKNSQLLLLSMSEIMNGGIDLGTLGNAARHQVVEFYNRHFLWQKILDFYQDLGGAPNHCR